MDELILFQRIYILSSYRIISYTIKIFINKNTIFRGYECYQAPKYPLYPKYPSSQNPIYLPYLPYYSTLFLKI